MPIFYLQRSRSAYGSVLLLLFANNRSLDHNNTYHCNLVCAKTRVAPLKIITIPRLELCDALLLVELMAKVEHALQLNQ